MSGMFYELSLEHTIFVHPRDFGQDLDTTVEKEMRKQLEGSLRQPYGLILMVKSVDTMAPFRLNDSLYGHAEVTAVCRVVVCRPFNNQVVEGVVSGLNQTGIFVESGPLQMYISRHNMPEGSKYLGGDAFDFGHSHRLIEKKDVLRVKLIKVQMKDRLFAIGTIDEDFLGLLLEDV